MKRSPALQSVVAPPIVAVILAVAGCEGGGEAPTGGRVAVVASVFPLADLARQVGGDHVTVTTLLPPGESPHGFQPKPRQVEAVGRARLFLTVGLGMDLWADRAARAGGGRQLSILDFSKVVGEGPAGAESREGPDHADHPYAAGDPHLWLDPVLTKAYVRALADRLAEIDPEHAGAYRSRGEAYGMQLDALHAEYRATLATARRKAFVSFHAAFTHLAARYGLRQETVFEEGRGGVGAKHLEAVVRFIKENEITVVFAEPQFDASTLRAIADQTGTTVKTLDPLGSASTPGGSSYLALMRTNLAILAEALECTHVPAATQPTS